MGRAGGWEVEVAEVGADVVVWGLLATAISTLVKTFYRRGAWPLENGRQ